MMQDQPFATEGREVIFQFYRNLYRVKDNPEFLCRGNDLFMHPVLTPNFFQGSIPDAGQLENNRAYFRRDFNQPRHWLQLFPGQIDEKVLAQSGYRQTMSCAFNIFTSPLPEKPGSASLIEMSERIPAALRLEYEQKTDANCHNLPPAILQKIELVLRGAAEVMYHAMAYGARGDLSGAVTIVRAGPVSMFVNAWVDQPERSRGIMRALFSKALRQELGAGQSAAFYWTFNPIIAAKGNRTDQVRVFEFQQDPLQ